MKRLALGLVAPLCCWTAVCAAQVPALQRCRPLAVPPGSATTVQFLGTNLAEARSLWASFPTARPIEWVLPKDPAAKPDPTQVAFRIEPRADVVPGIYAVRLAAGGGVSNLRLLVVDDLPTTAEVSTNIDPAKAQRLQLPTAVDGACTAEQVDYFVFHAQAGRRLSFEVLAKRIGSSLDPLLRLVEVSTGRVLAEADDDPVVGADARFVHRFERAGDYRLELRDIRYAGGANHVYRLRIGEFPLTGAPYPAAVRKGAKAVLEASDLAAGKPVSFAVESSATTGDAVMPLAVRYAPQAVAGFSSALVSDREEQCEIEPNDADERAVPLTIGGAMNGRIDAPRDRDCYRLTGKKGDKFRIVGRTRSLGSPADLYLQLYAPDGKRLLAETDDAGLDEGVLDVALEADGAYLVVVEELIGRGGPEFVYRLEVERSRPGFTAAIDAEKFDVPHAGLASAKISVIRSGYAGEIRFRVEGAGAIEAVGTIPADKLEGTVQLCVPPGYGPGAMLDLRLVAEAAGGDFSTEVSTAAAQRRSLGGIAKLPPMLREAIVIGVTPPAKSDFTLKAASPALRWNADGTQGELVVKLERGKAFAEAVKLQVGGLPPGYDSAGATIAKDKTEATIVVSGPAGARPPRASLFLIGTATVKKLLVQSSLTDVALVGDSTATVAASGPKSPTRVEP